MPRRQHSYRLHKHSGQAFVEIAGKRHYLGKHGTPASWEKYHRLLAEHAVAKPLDGTPTTRVNDLIQRFWAHVQKRYVKNGVPTSERRAYRVALRVVRELYGSQLVNEFGPLALTVCRQKLMDDGYMGRVGKQTNDKGEPEPKYEKRFYCRKKLNEYTERIRRMFKWGVAMEIVQPATWQALTAVEGLAKGEAHDPPDVKPVEMELVERTRPLLTPQVRAMVDFQLATGCRPGEACSIRTADITMHDGVWLYRPWTYKTEHQDIERVIYLGPRAQEIIRPWLRCDLDKPLFSPREAREAYLASRRKNAKRKPRKASPKRQPGEVYTNNTYARAILKACKRGGLPHWAPNQLRHTAGTEIRRQFGAEMARLILGHQKLSTTELYAEADYKRAIEIVSLVG